MSLVAQHLSFERGQRLLQNDINFYVEMGQALWVRGSNGVGKSTLLETLCGFRMPSNGHILWNDRPVKDNLDSYHEALSYIGHKNGNNANLTAEKTLDFYNKLYESNNLNKSLEVVGLRDRAAVPVRELSSGQQKRLALARLVLCDCKLWILDEPSVSLDHEGIELLVRLMKDKLSEGGMVVFTSHVDLGLKAQELRLMPISRSNSKDSDEFLSGDWESVI